MSLDAITTADLEQTKVSSRPFGERPALIGLLVALLLGWSLAVPFFLNSWYVSEYNPFGGVVLLTGTILFCFYMWCFTRQLLSESQLKFTLEFSNSGVTFSSYDSKNQRGGSESMRWKELKSADYYSPTDLESLLLHSSAKDLEIPLWAFPAPAKKSIIESVIGQGVQLHTIP